MASVNSTTTLAGLFKEVYGDSVLDLTKFTSKLARRISFDEAKQQGNKFHQPLNVKLEHAVNYGATNTTLSSLLTINTGQTQDAQVDGSQMLGRSAVDYESIARSMGGGAKAFLQATKHVVRNLSNSMAKRLEIQLLHGRRGLGVISAIAAEGGAGPYTTVCTISDAAWSAGLWAGMVGATLDIYDTTFATQRNINGGNTVVCTITKVDVANKQITISYATARASWTVAWNSSTTDVFFFQSASATTEFVGLDSICRNTGTLYGIDSTVYELLGGNIYSTSTGVLSMAKLLEAISITASFGLEQDVVAVVSPKAYEVLNSDLAALRMLDSSYGSGKAETGTESIKYHGQTGSIEILAHPFQKDGLVHVFCPSEAKRIGATDLTFVRRHGTDEPLILESSTAGQAEMRIFGHQALFIEAPRHTVVMDGLTY